MGLMFGVTLTSLNDCNFYQNALILAHILCTLKLPGDIASQGFFFKTDFQKKVQIKILSEMATFSRNVQY